MTSQRPRVLFQGFYKRGKYVAVPCPADGSGTDWWWDHLAKQAHALAQAGFTEVWLPPVTKAAQGVSAAALGYSVFDDYDIGSKNQRASIHTRYGTREQLARCVATMRANGLDVYLDLQHNHRRGGTGPNKSTFRYVDAYGKLGGGRFPKDPQNFHSRYPEHPIPGAFRADVPQDPNVPLGIAELQPPFKEYFGPDLAHITGKPSGYVFNNLIANAEWLTRSLDVQGYRLDHVPGISTDFLFPFLEHSVMQGKFAVAEYFTGDLPKLRVWISDPHGMRKRCRAFDFPLWGTLLQMCNHTAAFDMANLDHAGLAGVDPFHAVTFVENHDTESRPDIIPDHIIRHKPLAYAYILTSEGLPCVFYKDYSMDPQCLGLQAVIDNLLWIHQQIAAGPTQQRWKDGGVFAFERLGGNHLLVALNKDEVSSRTITVDTGFGPGATLHDYTGHAGDVRTDGSGRVTITIPRNHGGFGYVCYSRSGLPGERPPAPSHTVTQIHEGARELDIKPAESSAPVRACRLWPATGSALTAVLTYDVAGWTPETHIILTVRDPAGHPVATKTYTIGASGESVTLMAAKEGWHIFDIQSFRTPATNANPPYALSVTYTAPTVPSALL